MIDGQETLKPGLASLALSCICWEFLSAGGLRDRRELHYLAVKQSMWPISAKEIKFVY